MFCIIQLGAAMSDQTAGSADKFSITAARVALSNLPFAGQCLCQYLLFRYLHQSLTRPTTIAAVFFWSFFIICLPMLAWQAAVNPIILGAQPWSSLPQHISKYPAVYQTVDFLLFCGCFAGSYALCLKQENAAVAMARMIADRENLELRLALEQQRFATLQAQLEPHFLFNALNSIGGLIRLGDKRLALKALSQLSMLLRYALEVSGIRRVRLERELTFVRDYLALQMLRFEDRLTVVITGESEQTLDCLIPPLLLQPLVENAIRHDLERHALMSDLKMEIEILDNVLNISISNPLRNEFQPNPGLGIGLGHVANKMSVIYGSMASIKTELIDSRYTVKLTMPAHCHE